MKLHQPYADLFIPDGLPVEKALARTTHMGIGAHQDDLELMMYHPILACFREPEKWFTGVTVTDGRGSSRTGPYAHFSDEQMREVRRREQRHAAALGEYAAMIQLDYSSKEAKDPTNRALIEDLKTILLAARPEIVHTHNPADKHDTHVAVVVPVLQAIRELPAKQRPKALYGMEAWRSLDWMPDDEKVIFDISARAHLFASLAGVWDSQIGGGKRYDLGCAGRKQANATLLASHAADKATMLEFGMDLTPLLRDDSLDLVEYTRDLIRRLEADVVARLSKRLGR
ncbi:MAG: PIG-L family deacetylase [Verrucomicrobiae bacterium]|nr:PIG-L family deacetylase [Verrucomicrobiae bacterium]